MSARDLEEVPVLVVGAGPAGLGAALALAEAGVETLLVERRRRPSDLPRATVVSVRSMERIRGHGLEDEVRAGAPDVESVGLEARTLAEAEDGTAFPTGLPTRLQAAMVSPTAPAWAPQDHLEAVLRRRLAALPAARIELGTEVLSVSVGDEEVVATLRDEAGGERLVNAANLVAADGAHSRIRETLGVGMPLGAKLLDGIQVLFRAPVWDIVGDSLHGLYSVSHPAAPGAFLPAGRADRWLYGLPLRDGAPGPENVTAELLAEQIRIGSGRDSLKPRIDRFGTFGYVAGLAETFRRGPAFLVGDAAHRVTPRGGTGMNMSLQDGFDLGWKLAWVHRGWAPTSLLDSYEAERRPIAEHNVARSQSEDGTTRDAADEVHIDLGGRIPHVWTNGRDRVSTIDLPGPGWTLLTGNPERWSLGAAAAKDAAPISVRRLDHIAARTLGVGGGSALLVRPDAVAVAWLGVPGRSGVAIEAATAAAVGARRDGEQKAAAIARR